MREEDAAAGPLTDLPTGFRGIYRTDPPARAVYSEAAGIARVVPRAVAVPADADDLRLLVQWARGRAVPLVPRGSGSSMPGGAIGDGVVVDLSRMNAIGAVDRTSARVAVGPGAIRNAVDAAARANGLRFPVDPSSGAFCTVGGMVATNAAGARSFRFGATRRWVTALDCVFADGARAIVARGAPPPAGVPAIARFMRDVAPALRASEDSLAPPGLRKNSSGYALGDFRASGELVELLVGSEGTLALIVGVELALADIPGATASLLASFASLDDAVAGTEAVRAGVTEAPAPRTAGAGGGKNEQRPRSASAVSACELIDRTFLDVARQGSREGWSLPVPADTEAVLLIEVEGSDTRAAHDAGRALAGRLRELGATDVAVGLDLDSQDQLWTLRHAASPILSRLGSSLKSMQFVEDGVVPPARLADYVRGIRSALARHQVRGVIFGHAGDAHVHVNALMDVRSPEWRARLSGVLTEVVELTAALGGSLAGEHGDGRLRAPLVRETLGDAAVDLYARTKHAFDPSGILNPGVKVPTPGQEALTDIKYDPRLPPLPAPAARVLARVERDRAYAEFRLDAVDREMALERKAGTR